MKINQYSLLQITSILLSIFILACPTLAKDMASGDAVIDANATDPSSKSNALVSQSSQIVDKKATLSKKIFSIATAFFIGTPVCVVRRTKYEEWYGVHGMIGDSESKTKKVLAGTFWLPFAVVTGTAEAPFDALANGIMYPALSKDQLSQGKLIQNN
jgi:hypothetical protein